MFLLGLLISVVAIIATLLLFILAQHKDEIWGNIVFEDDSHKNKKLGGDKNE